MGNIRYKFLKFRVLMAMQDCKPLALNPTPVCLGSPFRGGSGLRDFWGLQGPQAEGIHPLGDAVYFEKEIPPQKPILARGVWPELGEFPVTSGPLKPPKPSTLNPLSPKLRTSNPKP